jgi:hypothetical protein
MTETRPEAWLRGPVAGYDPLLMSVVHALVQAREDIESLIAVMPAEQVWATPGGAAPRRPGDHNGEGPAGAYGVGMELVQTLPALYAVVMPLHHALENGEPV